MRSPMLVTFFFNQGLQTNPRNIKAITNTHQPRSYLPDLRKLAATESKKKDYVPLKYLPQQMKKVKIVHGEGSRSIPKIPIRKKNSWPAKARVADAGSTPR